MSSYLNAFNGVAPGYTLNPAADDAHAFRALALNNDNKQATWLADPVSGTFTTPANMMFAAGGVNMASASSVRVSRQRLSEGGRFLVTVMIGGGTSSADVAANASIITSPTALPIADRPEHDIQVGTIEITHGDPTVAANARLAFIAITNAGAVSIRRFGADAGAAGVIEFPSFTASYITGVGGP